MSANSSENGEKLAKMAEILAEAGVSTKQKKFHPRKNKARTQYMTPYAAASSGVKARDEVIKILRRFGCESVGFWDDFDKHEIVLAFKHRDRPIQLRASAKGWAAMYLKANPYTARRRASRMEHEAAALRQGYIAVNSILRDWIKGQTVAVECGILSFEAIFMPFMIGRDGRTLMEHAELQNLLPAPQETVVPLRKDRT
jgi:hypothetical protein